MERPRYSWKEIENKLIDIAMEQFGIERSEVTLDSNFIDDLGADSLDGVEFIMEVEDEFDISIPEETAEQIVPPTIINGIRTFLENFPLEAREMVDTKILSFRLRPDISIAVALRLEDGSWTYADGETLLPSMLYVFIVSKWGPILRELEDIINDPKTKEKDLQMFFEEYPELISGDDYDVVVPQAIISRDDSSSWRADFVLAPVNQNEFCKIVELKLPNVPLVTKPHHGHIDFSSKIWHAIRQLRDYAQAFDDHKVRERFREKYQTDVYKPEMHLIAGRRWNFWWMDNIRQILRSTPVKIEDWPSVLDRLKRRYE